MPESAPNSERQLELMARSLETGICSETYDNLNCPKISVSRDTDMSWLIGLQFDNGLLVGSAFQQSQFKMDHNGVSARSAVAISTLATCGPYSGKARQMQVLEINRPFIMSITDLNRNPVFISYLSKDSWYIKNAG